MELQSIAQNDLQIATSLIGVGGTLLGTFMGFLLGKINIGKLYFYFNYVEDIVSNLDYTYSLGDKPQRLRGITFSFDLRIYNSSDKNKVINDCKLLLYRDKELLKSKNIIDPSSIKAGIITTCDYITALNIKEKSAINITINAKIDICNDEIDNILKANKLVFNYKNHKFRNKYKKITMIDISKIEKIKAINQQGIYNE